MSHDKIGTTEKKEKNWTTDYTLPTMRDGGSPNNPFVCDKKKI